MYVGPGPTALGMFVCPKAGKSDMLATVICDAGMWCEAYAAEGVLLPEWKQHLVLGVHHYSSLCAVYSSHKKFDVLESGYMSQQSTCS